jgi:murein DD-endopeptidase MepM/ murein hydrolase activator NlpD
LPWPLLHIFVVGLTLAVGLASVSLASEAQRAEVQGSTDSSSPVAQRSTIGAENPLTALSLVAPGYVPPPQSLVAGPELIETHLLPPPPCVDDPAHPTFCVYTVDSGDTLSGIAQRFGLKGNDYLSAVEMLAQSNKPDVISSDQILPGQKLRLPKQTGIIVTLLVSKTLGEIAGAYGVTAEAVAAVPENGIGNAGEVRVGQDVLIPDPKRLPVANAAAAIPTVEPGPAETQVPPPIDDTPEVVETQPPTPTATLKPNVTPTRTPNAGSQPSVTPTTRSDRPTGQSKYGFIWPVWGPISSYFGPSHPLGIDIDLYHDPNAPIAAAKKGIVTFAGGNACCSYGLYVVVDHGDGTQTLYAHLSQISVTQGQQVAQGQQLGFGGRTGYATGNHLHFEIHVGDNVVDPLIFLP